MDVVLFTDVSSPGFGRYAGTYRIATELRDHGFDVQVIEYFTRWTTDELKKIITRFVSRDTLLIGISTNRYFPAKGTAGLHLNLVKGYKRVPLPPPIITQ